MTKTSKILKLLEDPKIWAAFKIKMSPKFIGYRYNTPIYRMLKK